MTPSNRLAKEKMRLFEALAAYANIGDTPAEWKRFRLMYADFFPQELGQWMYEGAEEWHSLPEAVRRYLPPLLWYRNRLRSVWASTDQHGYSLAILLGFEREAEKIAADHRGEIGYEGLLSRALSVPGRTLADLSDGRVKGLPQGNAVINGVTGQIQWEFGCTLQQAIYELMQERWRTKICPQCGKFFVAMKTAQKLCSVRCSDETKRGRALTWWNDKGIERRAKTKKRKQAKRKERKPR